MIQIIYYGAFLFWAWKAVFAFIEFRRTGKAFKEYKNTVDDLGLVLDYANAYAVNVHPQKREEIKQIVEQVEQCALRCNAAEERVNVAQKITSTKMREMQLALIPVLVLFITLIIVE